MLLLTTTGNGKCIPVSDTMEITIAPLPVIEAGPEKIVCTGSTVSFQVQTWPDVTYTWREGNTVLPETSNSLSVVAGNGVFMYYVRASDANSCAYEDSVQLTGIPYPVVSLQDTSMCIGQTVVLDAKPGTTGNPIFRDPVFEWKRDNEPLPDKDAVVVADKAGVYTVKASLGSCVNSAEATVTVHPLPVPQLPDNAKFCPETDRAAVIDAGPAARYLWSTGDTTRMVHAVSSGEYEVTVTNEFGCSASDRIFVCDGCPPRVILSNSFTPNQDGTNEYYTVYGAYFSNFHMFIFNRWGEIIFESRDKGEVWDGYYLGEPMPIGVYPWIITYEGVCGDKGPYRMEGSVTVVR